MFKSFHKAQQVSHEILDFYKKHGLLNFAELTNDDKLFMGADPATNVTVPITAWFSMDPDQKGKSLSVGQHNVFNGINKLNGIGRKLNINDEGIATIWEG